ncbi:hypothetical protein PGT21_005047 [Puccinia graminis f. sp. tritici]|uniref:Cytoplasmic tRNA 2-thiolation protein 2 n=1 Tax=Puccinia graminis f. sp. tritici TaxID=56615 RepID=A0A5B0PSX4_PUCGR|nr:hypothetical protein PGT21_005047 [Puccinia graminis f. sp. tritici]
MEQKNCCKCQATNTIELSTIRNTTWCRQCFIEQINIKFFQGLKIAKEYCRPPPKRDGIRTITEPASLVIHFKNDLSSFLTLQLMRNYLNTNQDRSTAKWKSPIDFSTIEVISIDFGSASSFISIDSSSETKLVNEEGNRPLTEDEGTLRSMVESLGFSLKILNLDDLFDSPASVEESSPNGCSPRCFVDLSDPNLPIKTIAPTDPRFSTPSSTETVMKPLANTLRPLTQTSRRSLIESLINKRLLDFCKHKPRNKVLVKPTTSTQMAIDTLAGVSLGNGWSLDQQIGPSSCIDDVLVCRPLAQIVDAELFQYSKLMQLDHSYPLIHQAPTKKADIPALITDFVVKLEENYPMTSSVINQTVNKIGKNKSALTSSSTTSPKTTRTATNGKDCSVTRTCPICHLSSDREANEWKRSITLSTHEPPTTATPNARSDESEIVRPVEEEEEDEPMRLRDQLCYACLVTFNDHQYIAHSSQSGHDWVQLPGFYQPLTQLPVAPAATPPRPSLSANHLQAVLDQFLISD